VLDRALQKRIRSDGGWCLPISIRTCICSRLRVREHRPVLWVLSCSASLPPESPRTSSFHQALLTGFLFLVAVSRSFESQILGFKMLSRGNSGAATRLRRAKSASSVQTYRPNSSDIVVDPETAYQHALAAASVAFEQAHGREVKSKSSGEYDTRQPPRDRQSIRFTGPTAVPLNQRSITRREAAEYACSRERSKTSSDARRSRREPSLRTSDSFVTALPEQNEEYVERRVSSIPSSYRKLRKTKSMSNPDKSSAFSLVNGLSRTKGHHSLRPPKNDTHARASQDSSLRRSLSFLRQPTASPEPLRKSIDQDKAVQVARDQFVRQLEQQRAKEKTSVVDFAEKRKSAKPFRRTVRSSSTTSYGSAIASPAAEALNPPKNQGLGRKARSISISLKSRLKRVFQKPSGNENVMPAQQLDASRPHFGDFMSSFNGTQQRYDHHIPSPDGNTIRRIDSRGSTSRGTSAFVERPSRPGSIRSIESGVGAEKDESRVSSWGTSTAANSLATLQSRENKRLSTINEGAPYQPSSMRSYGDLGHDLVTNTDPIRDFSAGSLYSRLRREIEKNERMARIRGETLNEEEQAAGGLNYVDNFTPRGSSLSNQQRGGVRMSKSVIFSPTTSMSGKQSEKSQYAHIRIQEPNLLSTESLHKSLERRDIGGSLIKRPLHEVKSTFFPPSIHLERNSTSPYRQAIRGSSESDSTAVKPVRTPNLSKIGTALNEQSPFLQVRNFTDSDSIYSRTTSGNTPRATDSPSSSSEDDERPGTAVVASQPIRWDQSSSPSHNRKTSTVQSSGDWKRWLSTEVAQLERKGTTPTRIHDGSSASTLGHKREKAQLDVDDVELGRLRLTHDKPVQPVAQQQGISQPRPILARQGTSESMVERYPLLEIGEPHPNAQGGQSPTKTSVPSQLRKQSDWENESPQSIRTLKQATELRPKSSRPSLQNQASSFTMQKRHGMSFVSSCTGSSDTLRTPSPHIAISSKAGLNSGGSHSPEREARLRRMQSSTSLDSRRNQENRPFANSETKGSNDGQLKGARPSFSATQSVSSVEKEASQGLIDRFLSNRRRHIRISEESGGDPAFI